MEIHFHHRDTESTERNTNTFGQDYRMNWINFKSCKSCPTLFMVFSVLSVSLWFNSSAFCDPLSPKDELATFKTLPGFKVELVASEPDVIDPVAMAFDEKGRLFVCEMIGYPHGGVGHRQGEPRPDSLPDRSGRRRPLHEERDLRRRPALPDRGACRGRAA